MNARPVTGDAGPYYFTYIDQVQGNDCLAAMTFQHEEALAFFRAISEEKSTHRYAPEKWSIRQVLNHVNDTERVFVMRALWFARGFDTHLPSYEQEIAVAGADADRLSWTALVEEFDHVRRASIKRVFEQLLDNTRRTLHHLTGSDLVGDVVGEDPDSTH